jgi:hypothetical protein
VTDAVWAAAKARPVTRRKRTVITAARRFMWLINESTGVPVTAEA